MGGVLPLRVPWSSPAAASAPSLLGNFFEQAASLRGQERKLLDKRKVGGTRSARDE